jgi:hypothetical protein
VKRRSPIKSRPTSNHGLCRVPPIHQDIGLGYTMLPRARTGSRSGRRDQQSLRIPGRVARFASRQPGRSFQAFRAARLRAFGLGARTRKVEFVRPIGDDLPRAIDLVGPREGRSYCDAPRRPEHGAWRWRRTARLSEGLYHTETAAAAEIVYCNPSSSVRTSRGTTVLEQLNLR